jgi:SH3-like domain-containing protein
MRTKNSIKIGTKAFFILLFISFLASCSSTETQQEQQEQSQTQEQQEQQEQQVQQVQQESQVQITEMKETVTGQTLRIIGDKVNVRIKPSIKGEILTQLRINEVFDIKGKTDNTTIIQTQTDYWYQIEKDGQKGWVFGALTTETLNEKENADDNNSILTIWGTKVNMRTKPSTKGEVIMQLNHGQVADVKKQTEDYETIGYDTDYWYQIEVNGKRGWIFGTFTSRQLVFEGCSG